MTRNAREGERGDREASPRPPVPPDRPPFGLYDLDLTALANQRVRQQITDAATRRTTRRNRRATLTETRTAGLTIRHTNRLDHLSNRTPAATAA